MTTSFIGARRSGIRAVLRLCMRFLVGASLGGAAAGAGETGVLIATLVVVLVLPSFLPHRREPEEVRAGVLILRVGVLVPEDSGKVRGEDSVGGS